jgi:HAD superfamily hydrolase (TIGR01549 family)
MLRPGPATLEAVQAVLLDMDGTIVDSDAAVARAWRRWATERGIKVAAPGAAELLRVLARLGLAWAVVTSADRRLANARLRAAGVHPTVLVTSQVVRKGKPDPEGYLQAAAALGVGPRRCLVVEDSLAGIRAGEAAGAAVAALKGLAADIEIADLRELSALLLDARGEAAGR